MAKTNPFFVWDKTNIGENYPGKTLPLTYSFVREAYANVYPHFLLLLGINESVIKQNRFIFDDLLGYLEGEIFYNINNWYELLKLLPGYTFNKKFFENMLQPVKRKKDVGNSETIKGLWTNGGVVIKFLYYLLFFKNLENRFNKKFDEFYKEYKSLKISTLDQFKLIAGFNQIQEKFYSLWAITIVNDFRTMIYFGILTTYAKRVLKEPDKYLSSVVSIKNQPRSLLPLSELNKLKIIIIRNRDYLLLFRKPAGEIINKLDDKKYKTLHIEIIKFLDTYGERSFNELKLEEPKIKDNPLGFIYLLKQYINNQDSKNKKVVNEKFSESTTILNRFILTFLREQSANAIYLREHFRLKRGKVFGLARNMFLELGRRLKEVGDMENESDVFYLYKDELMDYVQYHRSRFDIKKLIGERKHLFSELKKQELAKRVVTRNLPNQNVFDGGRKKAKQRISLKGVVTSRGFVRKAEVLVLKEIDYKADFSGKILVTHATDPGWTIIFPLLAGVITETGGLLSHASIISRELGIPCIVKVLLATQIFRTGDFVRMNAFSGEIDILK